MPADPLAMLRVHEEAALDRLELRRVPVDAGIDLDRELPVRRRDRHHLATELAERVRGIIHHHVLELRAMDSLREEKTRHAPLRMEDDLAVHSVDDDVVMPVNVEEEVVLLILLALARWIVRARALRPRLEIRAGRLRQDEIPRSRGKANLHELVRMAVGVNQSLRHFVLDVLPRGVVDHGKDIRSRIQREGGFRPTGGRTGDRYVPHPPVIDAGRSDRRQLLMRAVVADDRGDRRVHQRRAERGIVVDLDLIAPRVRGRDVIIPIEKGKAHVLRNGAVGMQQSRTDCERGYRCEQQEEHEKGRRGTDGTVHNTPFFVMRIHGALRSRSRRRDYSLYQRKLNSWQTWPRGPLHEGS